MLKKIFFSVAFLSTSSFAEVNQAVTRKALEESVINRAALPAKSLNPLATRCFCSAFCFEGTPDSAHFTKTVDVECSASLQDKRRNVASDLIQHYMSAHGVPSNVDDMLKNIEIRCISSNGP